jgi:hypothetical protein
VSPPFISRAFNLGAVLSELPTGGPLTDKRVNERRTRAA